jgi:serine/threonine protein phosphatase 1
MEIENKARTLCVGDIHGNYKGFKQALERCNFDNKIDTLISIGDVVDGHCDSFEVVEELLKIKNLIAIKGNHDDWFLQWLNTSINPSNWGQGQKATGLSYLKHSRPDEPWFSIKETPGGGKHYVETIKTNDIPDRHIYFFENQLPYYLDEKNNLFVHGGFNRHYPLSEQGDILWWDRDLWSQALSYGHISAMEGVDKPKFKMIGDYNEVFIGHTSTQFWKEDTPMHAANIWNLDTGGGWFGKISIMDIETKEFWQSDGSRELYPEFKGRTS